MVVLIACIENGNYVLLLCNGYIKIRTKIGPSSWRLCVIIDCGFGMQSLAFMVGIMILMFSIGALSCVIYLLAMRMEWVFELMKISIINIICLLMGFILNGVVSCKVYKIQKTKKKAISLLPRNLPEKMWKDVSVYCNQGGL